MTFESEKSEVGSGPARMLQLATPIERLLTDRVTIKTPSLPIRYPSRVTQEVSSGRPVKSVGSSGRQHVDPEQSG